MKSLVINLSQKCNAKCDHCCFSCLPNSVNCLTDEEIEAVVRYAETHEDVELVSLTGGEALLRKSKVLETIHRLSILGKDVTLITNGFWATNDKNTKSLLTSLRTAGLRYLTVSYDNYHSEYIPVDNIKRLFLHIKKPVVLVNLKNTIKSLKGLY
ncbi:radical SAM protein, partial [Streptococcus agalactiae]